MKLAILAIFRNEAHILKEWLDHYVEQGVEHFYLINNMSTDNYLNILNSYPVTLVDETYVGPTEVLKAGGKQVEAYNSLLPQVKSEWLHVCDLDEFAYGRNGLTLRSFLDEHENLFDQYLIPLKTFTSSGIIKQPESVVQNFTQRWKDEPYTLYKPLVRVSNINKIWVNYCTLKNGLTANGDFSIIDNSYVTNHKKKIHIDDDRRFRKSVMDTSFLVSNHYTVQSAEWYWNVKATRGTATWHGGPEMPAKDWFLHMWNRCHSRNTVEDLELILNKLKAENNHVGNV